MTNAPEIELVIFDVVGVLVHVDMSEAYALLGSRREAGGVDPAASKAPFEGSTVMDAFERGQIDKAALHRAIMAKIGADIPLDKFYAGWSAKIRGRFTSTVEIVEALHEQAEVRVALLTNITPILADWLRAHWPLFEQLPHVFTSYEIGARKPEAAAYRHVLDAMAVAPERAVMIDDREPNLAGARALGMRGILAVEPAQIEADLRAMTLRW